jgi:hypothetical protein
LSATITTWHIWPYYLIAVSLASLVTAIYYKDKLQMKLFALFLGFGLISIIYANNLIMLWLYIVLMIVWFVGYFTFNILKAKRRK